VIRLSKEARRWPVGVARKPLQAKAFYATILAAIVIGAIANVLTISPMRALVWIAVINGIVAVPVMTLRMLMAVNARVIGRFTVSGPVMWLGSLATGVMAAAAIGLGRPKVPSRVLAHGKSGRASRREVCNRSSGGVSLTASGTAYGALKTGLSDSQCR
jgi:hypothetical protein